MFHKNKESFKFFFLHKKYIYSLNLKKQNPLKLQCPLWVTVSHKVLLKLYELGLWPNPRIFTSPRMIK